MPGHILIVDAVSTTRIVMKVKLAAAYYSVAQAGSAREAMVQVRKHPPDLIILGDSLSDPDPLELCRKLRRHPFGRRIPVVIMQTDNTAAARVAALRAGADEVISRPVDDMMLLARLRSMIRARDAEEELSLRDGTARALGFAEEPPRFQAPGKIAFVISDNARRRIEQKRLAQGLPHQVAFLSPDEAVKRDDDLDVLVMTIDSQSAKHDLDLLAEMRARAGTRHAGLVVILPDGERELAARVLDLGANDIMIEPPDQEELALRLDTQLRTKRNSDALRDRLRDGMRAAVLDPLTGLYNRRYALPHLKRVLSKAAQSGRPCAVMMADLDHFKQINDRYGHAAGDAVLVEVAHRLHDNLRAFDLVARTGGEEFMIVMPEIRKSDAYAAAERLRRCVSDDPIAIPGREAPISVTISIGITLGDGGPDEVHSDAVKTLLAEADQALYRAKAHGRDQVTMSKTAA